jgi:hypothetical protein
MLIFMFIPDYRVMRRVWISAVGARKAVFGGFDRQHPGVMRCEILFLFSLVLVAGAYRDEDVGFGTEHVWFWVDQLLW